MYQPSSTPFRFDRNAYSQSDDQKQIHCEVVDCIVESAYNCGHELECLEEAKMEKDENNRIHQVQMQEYL